MTLWSIFDFAEKDQSLKKLQVETEKEDLWSDPVTAQSVMKQFADLKDEITYWTDLNRKAEDAYQLAELDDPSIAADLEAEVLSLEEELKNAEILVLLNGKYDSGKALLTINAGAGGTDSQDWAMMLQRMYLRWCERRGFKSEIIDLSEGEEAGIKSTTIAIQGKNAYGYLRSEKGVHRLVRLSPFDSAHRRHTSFVQVEILPELAENDTSISIPPEDVRIDIYRSSSAGGQNVQKNATAVRITHLPTGLVVSCQNERSQMQNRENAFRVLRGRLAQMQQEEQEKQLAELRGNYVKAEWGSQIRSYVLHPYQLVKDHRTDYETGNTQAVLDGDLDQFIETYLRSDANQITVNG